jgi:hypothetical protein
MAVENAEFGSQKLPTTVSVGALRVACSVNLPCGGSYHRGPGFSCRGSIPAFGSPKRIIPPLALGALRADTGGRHQAPAHLIVSHDGQQAAMQDDELLGR